MGNKIDSIINEFVNNLSSGSALSVGQQINDSIRTTKKSLQALESKQAINDRRILAALALAVQDTIPVDVKYTRNTCHFSYRSRDMEVKIDWHFGKWQIEGNALMHKRFIRGAAECPLTDEGMMQLAQQVSDYFGGRYRTLQAAPSAEPEGSRIDIDEIMRDE